MTIGLPISDMGLVPTPEAGDVAPIVRGGRNNGFDLGQALIDRPSFSRLNDTDMAELIGESGGDGNIQDALTARPKTSQLALPDASAGIGFAQSGSSNAAQTVEAKLRQSYSDTDKTTFAAAVSGKTSGLIAMPAGTRTLADTVTVTTDRVTLAGEGPYASVVSFSPGATKSAIKVSGSGASRFQGVIRDLGFTSNPIDTSAKTAIELVDARTYRVENIGISQGNWNGAGATGIKVAGRDSVFISGCNMGVARPLVFAQSPNAPSISTDGFVIEKSQMFTTEPTGKVIEIESGVTFSNTTFGPGLLLQKGKYGVYWNDTSSPVSSFGLRFVGLRTEQSGDPTGHSVYLASTVSALQSLSFQDCYFDPAMHGVYLRNARSVTFINCVFPSTSKTLLDITFQTDTVVTLIGCRSENGATLAMTNGRKIISRQPAITGAPIGAYDVWIYDSGTLANQMPVIVENGVNSWSYSASIANGGNILTPIIPTTGNTAMCEIWGGVDGGRVLIKGGGTTAALVGAGTGNFAATNAAGKLCAIDAGSGQLQVVNNTGAALNVFISAKWR